MRIIVKIGTNIITNRDGSLNCERIECLVKEVCSIRAQNNQVVIVTSGAIGAGMGKMGWVKRPTLLPEKQALAAIGQPILMAKYQDAFEKYGVVISQILLTRQDFDDRKRYLNARNTLLKLLEIGVVPIINENDTVATEEINFGDNDTLAALVAVKIFADMLILLTDVDGFYKGIPGKSELIHSIDEITPDILRHVSSVSGSGKGIGGMETKINAARIATTAGIKMVIANGGREGILNAILSGEKIGTVFNPIKNINARKSWIAFGTKCKGKIFIDEGATIALVKNGKSLLPSGIISIQGRFKAGDPVSIINPEGKEIARGLSFYSSDEINKIKRKKSSEIKKILGSVNYEEVVHRDNLVII